MRSIDHPAGPTTCFNCNKPLGKSSKYRATTKPRLCPKCGVEAREAARALAGTPNGHVRKKKVG